MNNGTNEQGAASISDETLSNLVSPASTEGSNSFDWSKVKLPEESGAGKKEEDASDAGAAGGQGNATTAPVETKSFDLRGIIKEKFGANADLGDDLSGENVVERLGKIFKPQAAEHPEVTALRSSLSKGLTPDQHYEQRTTLDRLIKMSDKDLMTEAYRARFGQTKERPNGKTDAEIKAIVEQREAQGHLLLDAADQRVALEAEKTRREQELQAASQQNSTNWADPAKKQEFVAEATKAAEAIAKTNGGRILGLEVAEAADKQAFIANMEKWLYPDAQTGTTRFQRFLQDNNRAAELSLVLELMEKGHFSKLALLAKDQAKMSLLNKLELQPARAGGAPALGNGNFTPDLDALIAPARMAE